MKHSISEAAKLTGKNRTTIHRHVKKSVISAEKSPTGHFLIDTSELERVYGLLHCNVAMQQNETTSEVHNVAVLQVQLEATKQMLQDAKRDRDDWKGQAQQAFMLLTHNPTTSSKNKKEDTELESNIAATKPTKRKKSLLDRLIAAAIES